MTRRATIARLRADLDAANRDREADEAPSDCVLADEGCRDGESACTASYAVCCGAYVGKEKP